MARWIPSVGDTISFHRGKKDKHTGTIVGVFSSFVSVYPHTVIVKDTKGDLIATELPIENSDIIGVCND